MQCAAWGPPGQTVVASLTVLQETNRCSHLPGSSMCCIPEKKEEKKWGGGHFPVPAVVNIPSTQWTCAHVPHSLPALAELSVQWGQLEGSERHVISPACFFPLNSPGKFTSCMHKTGTVLPWQVLGTRCRLCAAEAPILPQDTDPWSRRRLWRQIAL